MRSATIAAWKLVPTLRSHAEIGRQSYRGEVWYVMRDAASQRFHRFTPAAYRVIGLMDGERTVEDLWELAAGELGTVQAELEELITDLERLEQDLVAAGAPWTPGRTQPSR